MSKFSIVCFLVAALLVVSCSPKPVELTQEKLELYGNNLAEWGNEQQIPLAITINGSRVTIPGPSAGGYGRVYWESFWNEDRSNQQNLRAMIEQGSCDFNSIHQILSSPLKGLSQEQISSKLSCLGNVEFAPTNWAPL